MIVHGFASSIRQYIPSSTFCVKKLGMLNEFVKYHESFIKSNYAAPA